MRLMEEGESLLALKFTPREAAVLEEENSVACICIIETRVFFPPFHLSLRSPIFGSGSIAFSVGIEGGLLNLVFAEWGTMSNEMMSYEKG